MPTKRGDGVIGNLYETARLFEAFERLTEIVHRTPIKQSETLNDWTQSEVYLKLENLQKTGSFKVRGAFNKISQLTAAECAKGLLAASAGNHAQGVAMAGRKVGAKVTIFMPETTPAAKVAATRKYGATVKLVGKSFDEAYKAARTEQLATGATFIHPFDDITIIEGQATVAMEMLQQQPDLDTIIVPAGGGGLLAGTALAVKTIRPSVKVIGVQAANAPAIASAFHGRKSNPTHFLPTIAEGICVREPGKVTMDIIHNYVDDMITVTEQEISSAILFMLEREKLLVEGAAAAAIAAVLNKKLPVSSNRVGVIVSGGNFDVGKLGNCIAACNDSVLNF
ncbi:threonine ammonia-lyase [Sporosarcina sp. E16_8]|uniref:threonine ammonia-lyase n=1 Tax=Sporosarcina sp. E16_8 TaxID=2789295 RepID=UPI001A90ED98|nr:threonine ammonia-lyase [Sporosarcina sp. E16_8]MBO0589694.1 threonine ammonia-lyase [Sporosarcina sp. E16_8]